MQELKELYKMQTGLDELINKKRNVSYENTRTKRFLAFLVELAELANATRTFKYWSSKKAEPSQILLEEFADGLHFLLSLGLTYSLVVTEFHLGEKQNSVSDSFVEIFSAATNFNAKINLGNYQKLFDQFMTLGMMGLDFSFDEIFNAYKGKLQKNFQRQEQDY